MVMLVSGSSCKLLSWVTCTVGTAGGALLSSVLKFSNSDGISDRDTAEDLPGVIVELAWVGTGVD